jgi:hypothetical protein
LQAQRANRASDDFRFEPASYRTQEVNAMLTTQRIKLPVTTSHDRKDKDKSKSRSRSRSRD